MKKIYLLIIALLAVVSCNDNFLDKTPLDKLSEDAVFNSAALAESYVNALYTVIPDPFQEGSLSCVTDEGNFRYGGTSTRYLYDGSMSPTSVIYMSEGGQAHNTRTTTVNIWNSTYQSIYKMNFFINYVETKGSEMSQEDQNRLMGEVYFLRAWAYYNLIQRYAGVPLITKPSNLNDNFDAVRSNYDDCVDFILEDLAKAESLVPAKKDCALGRINKDIVLALRCRLTLIAASELFNDPANPEGNIFHGAYNAAKWDRAYEAAKAIVNRADVDGDYSLDPNYDGFWQNTTSKELIWAKFFNPTGNSENNANKKAQLFYSIVYYNGWTACEPTQAMTLDYEMTNGKKIFEEGSGFDLKHPFKNRDPRFYKTIATPFSKYCNTDNNGFHENELNLYLRYENKTMEDFAVGKPEPDWTEKSKDLWSGNTATGLELNKWYIPTTPITEAEIGSVLYPWFRLAEMYLNLAECAYRTGREDECRDYINKVRSRADVQMPLITETGTNLWDRLVNERRVELSFEHVRYFDVRRWKVAPFYENIPIAGMRTMLLVNGNVTDTVYRVVRPYNEALNNTNYYWTNSKARQDHITANGAENDIQNVVTYKWLGKEYKVDYGDCLLTLASTQKKFPESNYLVPIPSIEITKSHNMIVQNPGYSE